MSIIVTGAAGFIGSNLLQALNRRGETDIIAVDDLSLIHICSQPRSLSDMAQVSGVGARKLERYGQAFLDVLTDSPAAPAAPPQDLRHELASLALSLIHI